MTTTDGCNVNVINLDVSELEPPEPFSLVVGRLATLPDDAVLNMIHRQEPYPLYQTADEMGFSHHTIYPSDGVVHIQFWHKDNREAENYCSKKAPLG